MLLRAGSGLSGQWCRAKGVSGRAVPYRYEAKAAVTRASSSRKRASSSLGASVAAAAAAAAAADDDA